MVENGKARETLALRFIWLWINSESLFSIEFIHCTNHFDSISCPVLPLFQFAYCDSDFRELRLRVL